MSEDRDEPGHRPLQAEGEEIEINLTFSSKRCFIALVVALVVSLAGIILYLRWASESFDRFFHMEGNAFEQDFGEIVEMALAGCVLFLLTGCVLIFVGPILIAGFVLFVVVGSILVVGCAFFFGLIPILAVGFVLFLVGIMVAGCVLFFGPIFLVIDCIEVCCGEECVENNDVRTTTTSNINGDV